MIFGILILGAVTFFVLEVVNEKKNEAIARQNAVKKKIREYNDLIKHKERWEVRRDFVWRYQPRYRTEEEEAPALEAYFANHAVAADVTVDTLLKRAPEPLGGDETMVSLSLEAKVSGTGGSILNFLSRLQSETSFYAIPSITIKADTKDPSIVKADLIFSRWFVDEGDVPTMEAAEETPGTVAKKAGEATTEAEPN